MFFDATIGQDSPFGDLDPAYSEKIENVWALQCQERDGCHRPWIEQDRVSPKIEEC